MIKTFLIILLLYIGYKFVFGFVIPLLNTTRQMRNQVSEMTRRMQEQQRQQEVQQNQSKQTPKPASEDYIDYEEVK